MIDQTTKVVQVPGFMAAHMWPHVADFLSLGLTAATDVTLRGIAEDIGDGRALLWAIFVDDEISGAFVTSMREDDGERFVWVYALGGHDLGRWADLLADTVTEYAASSGASRVRFAGRRAWSRVLPSCRIIGEREGADIYERVAR